MAYRVLTGTSPCWEIPAVLVSWSVAPKMPQAQSPAPVESLSGLIERVTFFNEENGFAVLKVKVRGEREDVTVVGSLASVSPVKARMNS